MPAPTFSLPTSGSGRKQTAKGLLDAEVNRVISIVYDQANPEDRVAAAVSASESANSAADAAADRAAANASASAADTRANEAALAAQAAGAPLFASASAGEAATSDGEVFMVQMEPGTAVYQNEAGAGALRGWLGELLFQDVITLKASNVAGLSSGQTIRTRLENFVYKVEPIVVTDPDLQMASGTGLAVVKMGGRNMARAYGMVGDGSADDTAAFKKAVAAAGQGGVVDIGDGFNYLLTEGIYAECHVVGESNITFNIPNNTTDCFVMRPAQNFPVRLDVGIIDCQETGRDGVRFERGNPEGNFVVNNAYRDGLAFYCDGNRFDWIENAQFGKVRIGKAGRHGWHLTLRLDASEELHDTPFINETTVDSFEVRGIGRRFTDASPIRITYDGTIQGNTDKVSGFNINQMNVDVQYVNAIGTVSDLMNARSVNGGIGALEAVNINAGGIESTGAGGQVPGAPKFIEADPEISVRDIRFIGGITYNYCVDFGQAIIDDPASFVMVTNGSAGKGAYYPRAKRKSGVSAFEGETGGALTGFANAPVAQSFEVTMVASSSVTHDIPITALTDFQVQEPVLLILTHQGYRTSNSDRANGFWVLRVMEEGGSHYVHAWAVSTDSGNPANSFTPASDVTFTMPDAETIRVTIACGSGVGSGGRGAKVRGNVSRGLAGALQGALGNLATPLTL